MKLNLGACDVRIEGWTSVDIAPPADILTDLSQPWPWPTSSINEVLAQDIFEHLPNRIHTMNELHRVLRPGARATIIVPSASHGAGFAQDPTHQSAWCMNSFQYYEEGSFALKRFAKSYGITARFKVLVLQEASYQDVKELVWKVTAVVEAVK